MPPPSETLAVSFFYMYTNRFLFCVHTCKRHSFGGILEIKAKLFGILPFNNKKLWVAELRPSRRIERDTIYSLMWPQPHTPNRLAIALNGIVQKSFARKTRKKIYTYTHTWIWLRKKKTLLFFWVENLGNMSGQCRVWWIYNECERCLLNGFVWWSIVGHLFGSMWKSDICFMIISIKMSI